VWLNLFGIISGRKRLWWTHFKTAISVDKRVKQIEQKAIVDRGSKLKGKQAGKDIVMPKLLKKECYILKKGKSQADREQE